MQSYLTLVANDRDVLVANYRKHWSPLEQGATVRVGLGCRDTGRFPVGRRPSNQIIFNFTISKQIYHQKIFFKTILLKQIFVWRPPIWPPV